MLSTYNKYSCEWWEKVFVALGGLVYLPSNRKTLQRWYRLGVKSLRCG